MQEPTNSTPSFHDFKIVYLVDGMTSLLTLQLLHLRVDVLVESIDTYCQDDEAVQSDDTVT